MAQGKARIAVLVKGWPRLSETFVAQELVALEESGLELDLWSLRHPTDKQRHPLHNKLQAPVNYLPEYLRDEPVRVLRGVARVAVRQGFWRALGRFFQDYPRDRTRNRVRRFGQACVLAAEMPDDIGGFYAHFLHTPASVARYAAVIRNLPWSFSAHAKDIWTSEEWDLREKLSPATHGAAFGATCTAFGADHLRALSNGGTPVHLIYHGLDFSRFPDPPKRAPRAPDAPMTLLSVGRMVEKKGFDRLIDGLALLPASLDWRWVHIGGGDLGPSLKARAEAMGISNRIDWQGTRAQPEVVAAMRSADLFILPSRVAADGDRDGLPNVLMEAALQRLPILSTPVSAIPEFIKTGVHGTLIDDTPQAIAEAIQTLAAAPENAAEMAEAALKRLKTEFAMQPGIDRLADLLREMADAKK